MGQTMPLPEHIIASNEHGTYCVPASSKSRPAAAAVLAGKVWERKTISFMADNCAGGDIVHAGAYFGDFIPGLSKALRDQAHLWAFEPSSENYACAKKTLELNAIANATLTHGALGARAGIKLLRTGAPSYPAMGGASRVVKSEKPGFTHEDTRVVALDDVVPENRLVTIVQLDVEGFEKQALSGALQTIKRCMPILILETLPRDPDWFEREILSLGYREIAKIHANKVFSTAP